MLGDEKKGVGDEGKGRVDGEEKIEVGDEGEGERRRNR